MATNIMTSRFPPKQFVSRLPFALALLCAVPSCDDAADEDASSLRSIDATVEPGSCPALEDDIKGTPIIVCPHCGSHWTITEDNQIAVFLTRELGDAVIPLSDSGEARVFVGKQFGSMSLYSAEIDDFGYSFIVDEQSVYESAWMVPSYRRQIGVVRLGHDTALVDLRIPYVNSATCAFETPELK